jgi:hypothetical protein
MKRAITDYLIRWKESKNRKPLIVRGARQVGKTYSIEEFGRNHFKEYIKINFEEVPDFMSVFESRDISEIIQTIEVYFSIKISEGDSLLFLDEIQACPAALTALRYFYERKPGLHIIAAGSLLDHILNDLKYAMPVGRVEFAYMFPMSFYEFLSSLGEEKLVRYLESYSLEVKIPLPIHTKAMQFIRLYYFIGGMPESVKIYNETKSLNDVEKVHESILKSLEFDFAKYGNRIQHQLLVKTFRYIPKGVGRKLKYVNIDDSARSSLIKESLLLLEYSRIIHIIKTTNANLPPLEYGINEKLFKPLLLDIGLANHLLGLNLIEIDKLLTTHEGSLAEQFVGQQLLSFTPFFKDKKLFYWSRETRNSEAEIDYLIEINGEIIPLEVKAGKSGTLKSLHVFMSEKEKQLALRINADFPSAVKIDTTVTANKKIKKVNYRLLSLPLYLMNDKVLTGLTKTFKPTK